MKTSHIILVLLFTCTVLLSSCKSTSNEITKEEEEKVMVSSEISRIYYQYRAARSWSYNIEIKRRLWLLSSCWIRWPWEFILTYRFNMGRSRVCENCKVVFDRIVEVIDDNDVLLERIWRIWLEAKDGWGFNLSIDFENGAHLVADGENEFYRDIL